MRKNVRAKVNTEKKMKIEDMPRKGTFLKELTSSRYFFVKNVEKLLKSRTFLDVIRRN